MAERWDGTWNPTLARALSDQRVEEFYLMLQFILHKWPQSGACNGWVWIGAQFSVRGAYKRLCEGHHKENPSILRMTSPSMKT